MVDIVLDVGFRALPESLRDIRRNVQAAFRQIEPEIDVDINAIQRELSRGAFRINVEGLTSEAIRDVQNDVRRRIRIEFDNVTIAENALRRLRRDVEANTRIALETTGRLQRAQVAAALPGSGEPGQQQVQEAQALAAQAARRLAESQTRLALAEREFEQLVQRQTRTRSRSTNDIERLNRNFERNQRSLNRAVQRAAESRRREAQQQASQEARRLRQDFNRNQRNLNRAVREAARQRDREARENGRLLARSINVEQARQREIRRFLGQIQRSISASRDVEATERQLSAALRRRVAEERRSGGIRGGTGAPAVQGLADVTALSPGLNTREFERLRLILSQTAADARRLAGQTQGLGGRVRNLDNESRRLNQTLRRTQSGFRRGGRAAQGFTARVARATQTVLAFAGPTALIFGAVNQIERAVQTITELDAQARRLVFFQEAGPFVSAAQGVTNFDISVQRINQTIGELVSLSARTGINVESLATALVTVTRIGQEADSQFASTVVSLLRIEGAALNAEQAVRLLNTVQIQFLNTLEDFDQGIADQSIRNVGNLIEVTAAQSAFNVEQLLNALSRIGPALTSIQGTNINQAIGIIGRAASATGADVGRLSTTFRQLTTFVVQNAEAIRRETGGTTGLNILDDATGQIRNFDAILDFLEEINRLSQAGSPRAIQLALQGADRRNVASVLALARNVEQLRQEFDEAGNARLREERAAAAAVATLEAEQAATQSIQGALERLRSTFLEFFAEPAVKNFLVDVIERGIEAIQLFQRGIREISRFGAQFQRVGEIVAETGGNIATSAREASGIFSNVVGLLSPLIGIFITLTDFQRESNVQAQIYTEEQLKQLAATDARIREQKLINAEEQQALRDAQAATVARQEFARLTEDIARITSQLASEELTATEATELRRDLADAIASRQSLGLQFISRQREETQAIAILEEQILREKAQQERATRNIAALQSVIAGFLTQEQEAELEFKISRDSLDRELSIVRDEINRVNSELNRTGEVDIKEQERLNRELAELRGRERDLDQRLQIAILNRQNQITESAFERANAQIGAWESAAESVTSAFRDVIRIQASIAQLFRQQGEIVESRIARQSQTIASFLETSGASIENRLREASSNAARQTSEIRRTGAAQLRALRDGADIDPFIDIDDVQIQTNRLLNIISASTEQIARGAESERARQIRETENQINRIRVQNATAEFQLRISRTQQELEIRSRILEQEISVIQERIRVERELNDLRRSQQEQFGRLLVESPEEFRKTVNDIATATRFFRGVTDINIDGLRTVFRRVQELRGEGQVEALRTILRGLEGASRFGREVVPGVGADQLRSVFERLQLNLPQDVNADLEAQAREARLQSDLQRRIEERERIQQQLIQFNIALQEAQLRLQSANAEIARNQRDEIITILRGQVEGFARNSRILSREFGNSLRSFSRGDPGVGTVLRPEVDAATQEANRLGRTFSDTTSSINQFNDALDGGARLLERRRQAIPGLAGGAIAQAARGGAIGGLPGTAGGPGGVLQAAAGQAFNDISQSLRPLASGRLQVVSPELTSNIREALRRLGVDITRLSPRQLFDELRRTIETTGGNREQRNLLRQLDRQLRSTIGGTTENQANVAARRTFRGDTAQEIEQGFRTLLQDQAGRDNDFVTTLRELRSQRNVDPEATRRLLSAQGLGGLAEGATTSRRAANVIDRLLRLSDDLSENQQRLTRDAGREIKRILSDEIAQGIRDLNEAVKETREAARREGQEVTRSEALTNALQNFSIASPEQLDRLSTTIRASFEDVSNEVTNRIREVTEDAAATLRGTTLELRIPADQEINTVLQVDVGRAINSEQFARQIAEQLSEALGGTIDPAVIDRISRQIIRITEPLVKAGIITASPSDLGTGE